MCENATKTAAELMTAIEPTLTALLNFAGIGSTTEGQNVIAAYNAALQAIKNWTPGANTTASVIELINAFLSVFNEITSVIPTGVSTLVNLLVAGIQGVLGVIEANEPSTDGTPQAVHAAAVVSATTATVHKLAPNAAFSIRKSILPGHGANAQYKKAWNNEVETLEKEGLANASVLKV